MNTNHLCHLFSTDAIVVTLPSIPDLDQFQFAIDRIGLEYKKLHADDAQLNQEIREGCRQLLSGCYFRFWSEK